MQKNQIVEINGCYENEDPRKRRPKTRVFVFVVRKQRPLGPVS